MTKAKSVLPDPARAAKGLTLKKLWRATPALEKNSARDKNVVLKGYRRTKTKGGLPAVVGVAVSMANKIPRRQHNCSVIGRDPLIKKMVDQPRVLVSCDCQRFCFVWEYANWTWGVSKILYSNGEPAVMTNAGNHPGMCLHLVKLVSTVVEKGD